MLISLCYFGVQYYVHFFSVSCSNLISSYCHHTLFITVGTTSCYGHLNLAQLGIPNLNTHLKLGWANNLILSPPVTT